MDGFIVHFISSEVSNSKQRLIDNMRESRNVRIYSTCCYDSLSRSPRMNEIDSHRHSTKNASLGPFKIHVWTSMDVWFEVNVGLLQPRQGSRGNVVQYVLYAMYCFRSVLRQLTSLCHLLGLIAGKVHSLIHKRLNRMAWLIIWD